MAVNVYVLWCEGGTQPYDVTYMPEIIDVYATREKAIDYCNRFCGCRKPLKNCARLDTDGSVLMRCHGVMYYSIVEKTVVE